MWFVTKEGRKEITKPKNILTLLGGVDKKKVSKLSFATILL